MVASSLGTEISFWTVVSLTLIFFCFSPLNPRSENHLHRSSYSFAHFSISIMIVRTTCMISDCEIKQRHPVKQWSVTIGDPKLTRLNLFRVRLLVGSAGLEKDAARFRLRNRSGSQLGDHCCKLCGEAEEDAIHFIAVCSYLASCRTTLISSAPESVKSIIPDWVTVPQEFAFVILGIEWVDHLPTQTFCIEFCGSLFYTLSPNHRSCHRSCLSAVHSPSRSVHRPLSRPPSRMQEKKKKK